MKATIEVCADRVEGEIDPRIYGHFIENMARCVYGGLLRNQRPGNARGPWKQRDDLVRMVKEIRPPVMRWPGGLYAEGYHWRDGIGPLKARPLNRNRYWSRLGPFTRVLDPHAFGSDEYMALVAELDTEPYVNVNLGTGSPGEAADWVEYMNGSSGTTGGALRASYGHERPYDVRLWGIGNEMYGFWTMGHRGPREYAARYLEFREAMDAVSDGLTCVAVGAEPLFGERWNQEVLQKAGDRIDLLSIHVYLPSFETAPLVSATKLLKGPSAAYRAIVASPLEFERRVVPAGKDIEAVMGADSGVGVALDEWNLWWKPSQVLIPRWTLRDALFACGMFHVFHRNSRFIKMANIAQLVNVLGVLRASGDRVCRTALYYPFLMYARLAGSRRLGLRVECGTFDSPRLGRIPPMTDVPVLDCSATLDTDGKSLTVFVINRHPTDDIEAGLKLKGFAPKGDAGVYCLNAPDPACENTFVNDELINIVEARMDVGEVMPRYSFPAHSVTALVLKTNLE